MLSKTCFTCRNGGLGSVVETLEEYDHLFVENYGNMQTEVGPGNALIGILARPPGYYRHTNTILAKFDT